MKNTNRFFLALVATSMLVGITGCQQLCKQMSTQVLQPVSSASALLATINKGADVVTSCPAVLTQLASIPTGAETIRKIAENKFTEHYSTCVDWEVATRWEYQCFVGPHGQQFCRAYPYTYQYCAAYQYHNDQSPGYKTAVDLSAHLDVMYEKAHHMCGSAQAGNLDAAYAESQDLKSYLSSVVQPEDDQVYALACNK